jgi:predicted flap endonuclease-1-like 5' DNA nuclease
MTILIGQIVGCLLVAAGIGGIIGWLLRHLSVSKLNQHIYDVTTALHIKEQALLSAQRELMAKASTIQINESDLASSEALARSVRQELASSADRLRAVQDELSTATQRVASLESEQQASLQRYHDSDATIAAYAEEARQADAGRTAAQEELNMKEQELLDLQNRLTEAKGSLAQLDGLRAQVAELEPAQGRVHWLEVQLTEKDVEHRAALHQVDSQLAERDRRIGELERLQPQLKEREALLTQWETKYAHTLAQHEAQLAKLQKQLAAQDQLRAQLLLDEQLLHERDERIAGLQHQIQELEAQQQDLAGQVKMAGEKQEEITHLRKRLVEVRAALRIKTNGGTVAPRQKTRQNGSQLYLQMEQAKAAKDGQKDDLSKIPGIGPVFARTLNKMGLHTFVQIARWKPEDIAKVAKKLYTAPDRIKRDNWVAGAKRLHREKYGERL